MKNKILASLFVLTFVFAATLSAQVTPTADKSTKSDQTIEKKADGTSTATATPKKACCSKEKAGCKDAKGAKAGCCKDGKGAKAGCCKDGKKAKAGCCKDGKGKSECTHDAKTGCKGHAEGAGCGHHTGDKAVEKEGTK